MGQNCAYVRCEKLMKRKGPKNGRNFSTYMISFTPFHLVHDLHLQKDLCQISKVKIKAVPIVSCSL